jgi:hypothetical protein
MSLSHPDGLVVLCLCPGGTKSLGTELGFHANFTELCQYKAPCHYARQAIKHHVISLAMLHQMAAEGNHRVLKLNGGGCKFADNSQRHSSSMWEKIWISEIQSVLAVFDVWDVFDVNDIFLPQHMMMKS